MTDRGFLVLLMLATLTGLIVFGILTLLFG